MTNHQSPLLPGATVGVFGSGQLGRMLALAARRMGYRIAVFSPDADSPAGQVADREVVADYMDVDAVRAFVRSVNAVTYEFENVPAHVAMIAREEGVPSRPRGRVLRTAQNRLREKTFFSEAGLPVASFVAVRSLVDLRAALETVCAPAILKTAAFGYDGKGQVRIEHPREAAEAWQAIGEQEAILECVVNFEREVSMVAARGLDGSFVHYGLIENRHVNHILDVSIAPAAVDKSLVVRAAQYTKIVMEKLDAVGVLCVEFFLTKDGRLLLNEIAPRPHNSGHLTIEAAVTSQFEQQLRAVCGLPLGATEIVRPAVMVNLLGDLWADGEPNWAALTAFPTAKLHLYGKAEARPGRKMGHVTVTAATVEEALETALAARAALRTDDDDVDDGRQTMDDR
ncbi:MAG: 5-(carboxyamino)imidazole ribonucleotide synthase, partial [Caldilineaceae bacterium]|nr:5-(carboxyamino)imidazole ribonucleotide synthase [Caldilineaceae bacterium]